MQESPVGAHGDDVQPKFSNHLESIAESRPAEKHEGNGPIGHSHTPSPAQSSLVDLCAATYDKVEAFLNAEPRTERIRNVQQQSRKSLGVIEEALERYSTSELSLSYNGGKDCLVLLILYLHALHAYYAKPSIKKSASNNTTNSHPPPHPAQIPSTIQSVYIVSPHPFSAIDNFVSSSTTRYHLSLSHYSNSMREAFTDYLHDHPQIKAIFVGTRRTDPHGGQLKDFDRTDRGWPDFMRIHPVIDWHYAEIWCFIRELGVPYCSLYDLGYTSLGGTEDTRPNPALRLAGADSDSGQETFRPAYDLVEDEEERLGRDR